MKCFLFIFMLILASCGNQSDSQNVRKFVNSSVVKITGKTQGGYSSGGTGFSVVGPSGKNYILTNKHICGLKDANNQLTIKFPSLNRTYKRSIIEISQDHDLCLVESLPTISQALTIANDIYVGEKTFVAGHPKLYALTVAEGQYIEEASINVRMSKGGAKGEVIEEVTKVPLMGLFNVKPFLSSRFIMYSRGGNSGSPIVNSSGQVVSVLFAGNRSDVMESYGVPLRYVKSFISGY